MSEKLKFPNRTEDATQLVEDYSLREDAEYFSDPATRLEFLRSLQFNEFFDIAQHINARVRGYEPRDRSTVNESGGYLPMLKTPKADEKQEAMRRGFETIQRYLGESSDTDDQKVRGAGMATEALLIWVHPFNDGNGRTSRFLGKFIEDGTIDTEQLITETADGNERMRMYPEYLRVDDVTDLSNQDILLDDDEIEQIKIAQEKLPITEGIALSLEMLLKDKSLQDRVEADSQRYHDMREQAIERKAA
ncbi:Fic family protein [Candidatus Saccharibacteria bacterium]|nr:Fic family protein [Candidatus Saccharibacteria bacterium]